MAKTDQNQNQTEKPAEKEPTIEEQAFDKDGKFQPGYQYRYVTRRKTDGTAETVRVVEKRG